MSRLEWDQEDRFFEYGVEKCVLYVYDENSTEKTPYINGVAWNGVIEITEGDDLKEPEAMFADNMKYASVRGIGTFKATLDAYQYPEEFEECDGCAIIENGASANMQGRKQFALCYRTEIGCAKNQNEAYALHFIYGAIALPTENDYDVWDDDPEETVMSWEIETKNCTSFMFNGVVYKPTAHIVIVPEKGRQDKISKLFQIIYGSINKNPMLPLPKELLRLIGDTEYAYLTFSSPNAFRMRTYPGVTVNAPWDGTLEVSTDGGQTWSEFLHETYVSSGAGNTVLMRGTGNTRLTNQAKLLEFDGTDISCSGNIETLLDWKTVANGGHPTPGKYAFRSMFSACENLVSCPDLSTVTLAEGCFVEMFMGCTALTALPLLPQTTIPSMCYFSMFEDCTGIKLSTTQTGEYQTAYRIPPSDTGRAGSLAMYRMFQSTGGTFTGTPTINTTYYISNTVVDGRTSLSFIRTGDTLMFTEQSGPDGDFDDYAFDGATLELNGGST